MTPAFEAEMILRIGHKLDDKDILLRAAEILEERGWCQGHYRHGGAFCAMGAIKEAAPLNSEAMNALDALSRRVEPHVAAWNDHPSRTASEVIAKLREVAASC